MKLLNCHIENFGVLSGFDFDFSEGLTVICKENGFGKSTFAAFIKAMFYGMPRTGARNVVENERKRYDPWQGGKYGGFLEFEYQGTRYRVTRYFGKTASKDTFLMMDMSNRQSRTPFSEKLGEELFQLDADSFARSTYMPQISAHDMEVTTSIRTKLSDLVDNTNDMNNFDTAAASLRQFRSKFRAYRGSGGIIGDLERNCIALDSRKYEAEAKKPRLQEVSEEIEHMNSERDAKIAAISALRKKIRTASAQKTLQLRQAQLHDLRTEVDKQQQFLRKLDNSYPAGYPTQEEIKMQRDNLTISQQAAQRLQTLVLPDEDCAIAESGKVLFPDIAKSSQDIDTCEQWCNELANVSAKLTSQMLPEELQRLDDLSAQFKEGIPSEEELQNCLTAADEMNAAQMQLSTLTMPAESQVHLEQLKALFRTGTPDNKVLTACEQSQRNREVLLKHRKTCELSDIERQDFQSLQRIFASVVPTEQEIQNRQKDCRRIVELTSIKNTKTTCVQEEVTPDQTASKLPFLCGGIGILFLIIGAVCFAMNFSVPGVLLLVAGFIGLLAAFWLHTRQMVSSKGKHTSVITASAITDAENQELYNLQRTLNDFLLQFYSNVADPDNKLVQLLLDMKRFTDLKNKKAALEAEQQQIDREIEENNEILHEVFERYYPGKPYRDTFVQELQESCRSYETLNTQISSMTHKRAELSDKIETCRTQVIQLLHRYYPVDLPTDLRQGVRKLASDMASYIELKHKKQTMKNDNEVYWIRSEELTAQIQKTLTDYECFNSQYSLNQCLQELRKRLEAYKLSSERAAHFVHDHEETSKQKQMAEESIRQFLQKYQLSGDTPANLINCADDDIRNRTVTESNLKEATEKMRAFLQENPEIEREQIANTEDLPDPEILQIAEKKTQEKIDAIDSQLREFRQERDALRRDVENIPILEDHMARLEAERQDAEKKCNLVDQAIELLNQAKDNLANSYVGKVESGFKKYANLLLEGQLGHVIVDKDLKLCIDEQGAAREVENFSTGMVDSIMLCMRLSLVDALFTKEKPFLILDDPFVNLDDEHTKRALEILKKISQDHQVVYLVCNSSRC